MNIFQLLHIPMLYLLYNYCEIMTIQLISYPSLKPVNWSFTYNQLTFQLTGFGSQP